MRMCSEGRSLCERGGEGGGALRYVPYDLRLEAKSVSFNFEMSRVRAATAAQAGRQQGHAFVAVVSLMNLEQQEPR